MATLPERLPGETTEAYHTRLLQLRQHEAIAGVEVDIDSDGHLHRVDIDPLLKRDGISHLDDPTEGILKPKGLRIVQQCIDSGEPYFVFRAKDIFSLMVLGEYAELIDKYLPQASEMAAGVADAKDEFHAWQVANPESLRYPD